MNEDGTAYAVALTIQNLLRLLERRGVLPAAEIQQLLADVSAQIRESGAGGAISPQAAAQASQTIEMIFLPLSRTIAAEDLNASNDE